MSNADMKKSTEELKKKSTEELKKEHRRLHRRLEKLREEMEYYAIEGGSSQTQEGAQEIMRDIEREIAEIRKRQREIFKEVMRRKRSKQP